MGSSKFSRFGVVIDLEGPVSSEFHLSGQHDQSSHGNWASSSDEFTDEYGGDEDPGGSRLRNFGLSGWPEDRRRAVLDTVAALRDKYPEVEKKLGMISINALDNQSNGAPAEQAVAVVFGGTAHIDIHPMAGDAAWLEENDSDITVSRNNLADLMTHEFGHVIENAMTDRMRLRMVRPFIEAQMDYNATVMREASPYPGKYADLVEKVSEYAGSDPSEAFAEAFLQYERGIRNEYSDHVGLIIEKWTKGRVKRGG